MTPAIEVRNLRRTFRVRGGLFGQDKQVVAVDDVSFSLPTGGVLGVVQGTELEEGLPVLNITCVVAWDLSDDDVPRRVGLGIDEGLFGTPRVVQGERGWDVTLRYAFPAVGLAEQPMGTMLMLVVSSASSMRAELVED